MIARPFIIGVLLVTLPALALVAAPKRKPVPTPSPSSPSAPAPAPIPAAMARVRIWKPEFPSKRAVRLTLRSATKGSEPMELGSFEGVSHFGDYVEVLSGEGTLEARAAEASDDPAATLVSRMAPGASSTLIVREKPTGEIRLELLDDTPTGDEASGELLVRNFVPSLETLQLDAGSDLHVRLSTPGSFLHMRGLPRALFQVETTGQNREGVQIHWSNEVDFRQVRRATLLVITDSYGRIRPRIFVDAGIATAGASQPEPVAVPVGEAR